MQSLRPYQWLLRLLTPALLLMGRKQDPARWQERLGRYSGPLPERPIWLHAASFGEAKAAGVLIEALRQQGYQGRWLVTTTTRTGGEAIQAFLRPGDQHLYAPLDLQSCVQRALRQIQPCLLVVMEVEIWPNLWAQCQRQGVPVVLVNARLSDRSLRKYLKFLPQLWRTTLQRADCILAQSEPISARFQQLGVAVERIRVSGNLKFSQALPADIKTQGAALRAQLGAQRPVWLAASTHEGEEAIALECHRVLLQHYPSLLLVIVPRHPARFERLAALCQQSGLSTQRRSLAADDPLSADTQLYLADTLGELLGFYAAADLCWVAGSFVEVGGHNILEPAACGCPIVVGPDMRNFETICEDFVAAQALEQVSTPAQLTDRLLALLADPAQRQAQASAALQQLRSYRDSADIQAQYCMEVIDASA